MDRRPGAFVFLCAFATLREIEEQLTYFGFASPGRRQSLERRLPCQSRFRRSVGKSRQKAPRFVGVDALQDRKRPHCLVGFPAEATGFPTQTAPSRLAIAR
jgi:hypothetical protein